jgi:hypothetical protein
MTQPKVVGGQWLRWKRYGEWRKAMAAAEGRVRFGRHRQRPPSAVVPVLELGGDARGERGAERGDEGRMGRGV